MHQPVIFREYDIRGVYNEQFDDQFAEDLGRAYAVYMNEKKGLRNPTIVIGYDARVSSPAIVKALSHGLVSSGANVINIGLVTTPVNYFTTFAMPGVDGAIQVTGSHNPPTHNGFKISVGKGTISGNEIQELGRIVASGKRLEGQGTQKNFDVHPTYLDSIREDFGQLKPIKVVLDCGNGAAGSIVARMFEAVGLKPTILFEQPDGRFPNHHPDPTVEKNLVDLRNQVLKEGAVCGIGFDGDADRIGVVDHTGRMIYGDEFMVLIARSILAKQPGAKIIGDVKCSDRMYDDVKKHGGQPIMWKTGHSLVKDKIKVEKAPFGGEMSGHVFFADRNFGYDDAPYAALRLCEILSQTGKTIPQLMEGYPPGFSTPEIRIDTTEEKKVLIVEEMKKAFPVKADADYKVDFTDGIRLSFKDGWALCRSSNTQPVVVVRFEATTAEGMKRIQDRVEAVVNKYL